MSKEKKEVSKALSDEEMTILTNIQSLIGQLLSASEAGNAIAESAASPTAQKQEGEKKDEEEEENGEKKEEKAKKELETTPSDSSTASDPATERVGETQTEETEESVDEVSKALAILLKGGMIAKSKKQTPDNPVIKALKDLTDVVKNISEAQGENEKAIEKLLDGIGITEQLKIAQKAQGEQTKGTAKETDVSKTVEFVNQIKAALEGGVAKKKDEETKGMTNQQIISKNLGDKNILGALVAGPRTMKQ